MSAPQRGRYASRMLGSPDSQLILQGAGSRRSTHSRMELCRIFLHSRGCYLWPSLPFLHEETAKKSDQTEIGTARTLEPFPQAAPPRNIKRTSLRTVPKSGSPGDPQNWGRAGLTGSRPMLGLRRFQKRRKYNRPRVLNPRHIENNRPRSDRDSGRATSQSLGWRFASALAREACPHPSAR